MPTPRGIVTNKIGHLPCTIPRSWATMSHGYVQSPLRLGNRWGKLTATPVAMIAVSRRRMPQDKVATASVSVAHPLPVKIRSNFRPNNISYLQLWQ